jgi:hypothetical protein
MQKLVVFCGLILALGLAMPAVAQDSTPVIDVSGGYSFVHVNVNGNVGTGPGSSFHNSANANGGSGSLAYNVNNWLGLVGDFGGYHNGNVENSGVDSTAFSYLFGPRYNWRHSAWTPYFQGLFGGTHIKVNPPAGPGVKSVTENAFAVALGGGIDVRASEHISIKIVQAEYYFTNFSFPSSLGLPTGSHLNHQNNVRLTFGVTFHFGSR